MRSPPQPIDPKELPDDGPTPDLAVISEVTGMAYGHCTGNFTTVTVSGGTSPGAVHRAIEQAGHTVPIS